MLRKKVLGGLYKSVQRIVKHLDRERTKDL